MKDLNKRNQCKQHIASYRSRGLSAKVWCENNNVTMLVLQYVHIYSKMSLNANYTIKSNNCIQHYNSAKCLDNFISE